MPQQESNAVTGDPMFEYDLSMSVTSTDPVDEWQCLRLRISDDRLVRSDLSPRDTKTPSSAQFGDPQLQLQRANVNSLLVAPNRHDESKHHLTFVPSQPADRGYRIVFDPDVCRPKESVPGTCPRRSTWKAAFEPRSNGFDLH